MECVTDRRGVRVVVRERLRSEDVPTVEKASVVVDGSVVGKR